MNLCPPGVWFADAMTSLSGVTFVLFCFVFVFVVSLKPQPFVQSSFDMQALRQPHVFLSFFPFLSWATLLFPIFFLPFSLCIESTSYGLSFRMVCFYLVTTGWIFDIRLCENSIKVSLSINTPNALSFSRGLCFHAFGHV